MKKDLTYVNSLGESICFGTNIPDKKTDWHFSDTDIFDFSLDYQTVGGQITSFYRGIREGSIEIFTHSSSLAERDRLVDVISYDTSINERGQLFAGSTYMRCNINAAEITDWWYSDDSYHATVKVVTDAPYWIREEDITLETDGETSDGGLDFPHDYPHDYGYSVGSAKVIKNRFRTPAKLNIAFPGPCTNPYIIIAGNRYQVMESAEKGSLILVKSFGIKKPTIVLRSPDGTERNIFGKGVREPGAKIFQKVPVGEHIASWSGPFNIALSLCEERYSPCWTS